MTSLLASMFGSASAGSTASRIDTMKAAEKALISFSHRFSWDDYDYYDYDDDGQHRIKNSRSRTSSSSWHCLENEYNEVDERHDIELFNTLIPRSVVPLKNQGKKHHCQLFSSYCSANVDPDAADAPNAANEIDVTNADSSEYLVMHGVQVTRKKTNTQQQHQKQST